MQHLTEWGSMIDYLGMLQAQARLIGVVELITQELERYEAEWQAKKLPKCQAHAHSLWKRGQHNERREEWQGRLDACKVHACSMASPIFVSCKAVLQVQLQDLHNDPSICLCH